MQDWSLSQLKAHQQFELGRIDSLRWVVERVECLKDDDNFEDLNEVKTKLKDHEATEREVQGLIQKIMDKRAEERQQQIDARTESHERFKGGNYGA